MCPSCTDFCGNFCAAGVWLAWSESVVRRMWSHDVECVWLLLNNMEEPVRVA